MSLVPSDQPTGNHRVAGRTVNRQAPASRAVDNLFAAVPAAWQFVFFIAPLAFTLVFSFGHAAFGSVELGFTLDNYRKALSGFYLTTFLRTVQFAVTGCVLCLVVAYTKSRGG